MKWYGHLFLYLIACVIVEFVLLMFFTLAAISGNDDSVWINFYIPQIGLPIIGAFVWLVIEISIDYDKKQAKEAEWFKEVNEMLKDYKESKKEENNENAQTPAR